MEKKAILLVEDDFLNRRVTKKVLNENNFHVFEAKNAREAVELLKNEVVDLVILDINLGKNEESGVIIGQQIKDKYEVPFIYLTAFESGSIIQEAVATAPYSYLTKPFKDVDLITSIELAIKQAGRKSVPKILVKDGEYNVELAIDAINYVESDGNYQMFYTNDKVYKSRLTVKQVSELLPERMFVQVHRAYIVNKTKIEKFNLKTVVVNDKEIPLSKNFAESLLSK